MHVLTFQWSAGTRTSSQLVPFVILYDEWWSAGGMSGGQLEQQVFILFEEWRSAGGMSGGQLVQCVAVS